MQHCGESTEPGCLTGTAASAIAPRSETGGARSAELGAGDREAAGELAKPRRLGPDHPRERAHRLEAGALQDPEEVGLMVRDVDRDRPRRADQRLREQERRDVGVLRDQGADVQGDAPGPRQDEACEVAIGLGEQRAARLAAGEVGQQPAALNWPIASPSSSISRQSSTV
jgi:hypothetical protein